MEDYPCKVRYSKCSFLWDLKNINLETKKFNSHPKCAAADFMLLGNLFDSLCLILEVKEHRSLIGLDSFVSFLILKFYNPPIQFIHD